ncbi:MAG: O-antigen ligase family protein, partial [Candidatus Dormibacteria bacterium]
PLIAPSRAALGAWVGACALATLLGLDPLSGLQVVAVMVLGAGFHLALVRWFDSAGIGENVLRAYLVCGALAAAATLAMWAGRVPEALFALNDGRATGPFVTADQCAAFLIAFCPLAAAAAVAARGSRRLLGALAAALGLAALGATFSAAALLGLGGGLAFVAWMQRLRFLAVGLALGALALGLAVLVRPSAHHDPARNFERLQLWATGLRVAQLMPLTGTGPMTYFRVYPAARPPDGPRPGTFGALHPHDAYLSLLDETGIVGIVAALYGWLRVGRALAAGARRVRGPRRVLFLGACAALVAIGIQGIFDTIGVVTMTFVWIPFSALALALARNPPES